MSQAVCKAREIWNTAWCGTGPGKRCREDFEQQEQRQQPCIDLIDSPPPPKRSRTPGELPQEDWEVITQHPNFPLVAEALEKMAEEDAVGMPLMSPGPDRNSPARFRYSPTAGPFAQQPKAMAGIRTSGWNTADQSNMTARGQRPARVRPRDGPMFYGNQTLGRRSIPSMQLRPDVPAVPKEALNLPIVNDAYERELQMESERHERAMMSRQHENYHNSVMRYETPSDFAL